MASSGQHLAILLTDRCRWAYGPLNGAFHLKWGLIVQFGEDTSERAEIYVGEPLLAYKSCLSALQMAMRVLGKYSKNVYVDLASALTELDPHVSAKQ